MKMLSVSLLAGLMLALLFSKPVLIPVLSLLIYVWLVGEIKQ